MIEGVDISKWQGELTSAAVTKMKEKGVRFAWIKFTQGIGYKDPQAENNTKLLQEAGILVGPYHFVTTDNGIDQYNWFVKNLGTFQFDLPPAMDCEAYTSTKSYSGESELVPVMKMNVFAKAYPGLFLAMDVGEEFSAVVSNDKVIVGKTYSYTYPTEAVVDVIGMRLTEWMKSQTKLSKFPFPAIYTNASSGNVIFKSLPMSKYLLWVANWNTNTPTLPKIWKNRPYLAWQNYVIKDATEWGISGQLDHNVWGNYMPFPEIVLPPPPNNTVKATLEFLDGSVYSGTIEKAS